jgi:hypothetical protein
MHQTHEKIRKAVESSVSNVSRLLIGLGLTTAIGLASSCKLEKINPKYGVLEGKVVGEQGPSLSQQSSKITPQWLFPQANEIANAKICLIDAERSIDSPCIKLAYTDQQGNFVIQIYPDSYNLCIDANNDNSYDECDYVTVKENKITNVGKQEIEYKPKKAFNCFIGLDKQNYCPGAIMQISVDCSGQSGYPYFLTGSFVNEKENDKVYDIIYIGEGDGNFSKVISYQLPITWPPTNSQPGSDWKAYLYSNSEAYGLVKEDKDNFNILRTCSDGGLTLEVILEGGKDVINYVNDVNATFVVNDEADQLAYCLSEQTTCQPPDDYVTFTQNKILNLPGQSGLKYVCGKAKKSSGTVSNVACDSIYVDLLPPVVNFVQLEQANLDGGQSLNDIYAEACISDNTGIKKVIGRIYNSSNSLIKEAELDFGEDQACARPGEIGYRTYITSNNVTDDTYRIELYAVDLAGNVGNKSANLRVDLTPPVIAITSPDHLLGNYVCYSDQSKTEEQCSGVDASEYRYDASYPEFYTNQVGLDGRLYDGWLDVNLSGNDESGIAAYEIDWGDGNVQTTTQTILAHPYVNSGYYTIKVRAKDGKGNWSDYKQLKAKIAIHRKDADWGFWNFVHNQVPGVADMIFYSDNCDAAIANNKSEYCYVTGENYRTCDLSPKAYYVRDIAQYAQRVGQVFVSLDKLVSNEMPILDPRLSNNEIVAANAQANSTPPWGIAIVPVTYAELISTENCPNYPEERRNRNYRSMDCWYKLADDRGDY